MIQNYDLFEETREKCFYLSDFTDETLEWCLSNEHLGGLLIAANLAQCDGSGTVTVGLLDS